MPSHTLTSPNPDTATSTIDAYTPGHLGELTRLLPEEMVDAAIDETRSRQKRLRDLPSRVIVYLLIAACLLPDVGYPQVWSKLIARLPVLSGPGQHCEQHVAAPTGQRDQGLVMLLALGAFPVVIRPR